MTRRLVLILIGLLACPAAHAPAASIDSDVRRDVVAKLSDALRENYIFPDVGEKAAEKINASLAAGEYDKLSDSGAFAARLSADVAAVAHDKHLRINLSGARPSGRGSPNRSSNASASSRNPLAPRR